MSKFGKQLTEFLKFNFAFNYLSQIQYNHFPIIFLPEFFAIRQKKISDLSTDVSFEGGKFLFCVDAEKVLGDKDSEILNLTLGEIIIRSPVFQQAVKRGFGGDDRDDQEFKKFKEGSVLVPLNCFTDERFLEVLDDFESGKIKKRLLKELSLIGIKVEGMKIEIINTKEVDKTKEAIKMK